MVLSMWSAIHETRACLAYSCISYSEKRYFLRRAEKACARSCFLERGIAQACAHAGSLRIQLSRFMASASRALYSDLAASRCARTWRSWLQSTRHGAIREERVVSSLASWCD